MIWDHALHFLIRQPHEDMKVTVIYKGRSTFERDVPLLSDKGGQPRVPTSPLDAEKNPVPTERTACETGPKLAIWEKSPPKQTSFQLSCFKLRKTRATKKHKANISFSFVLFAPCFYGGFLDRLSSRTWTFPLDSSTSASAFVEVDTYCFYITTGTTEYI